SSWLQAAAVFASLDVDLAAGLPVSVPVLDAVCHLSDAGEVLVHLAHRFPRAAVWENVVWRRPDLVDDVFDRVPVSVSCLWDPSRVHRHLGEAAPMLLNGASTQVLPLPTLTAAAVC